MLVLGLRLRLGILGSGVTVSRNAPEHHSGARIFKSGAFRL